MKRILVAANSYSAKGRGEQVLLQSEKEFVRLGLQLEIVTSNYANHLLETLPALLKDDWDLVVIIGGDGTLFQVINCCLKEPNFEAPIGLIPAGTGNSFSKEFHNRHDQSAVQRILNNPATPIDVIRCDLEKPVVGYDSCYYFMTVLGLGFVADATIKAIQFKHLGVMAYAAAVLTSLKNLSTTTTKLTLDDAVIEREAVFTNICNSRYVGGNMFISPNGKIDDGFLDVVLLNQVNRLTVVKAFPTVFSGKHLDHPKVESFRGKKVRIESDPPQMLSPDGEIVGQTPVEIELLPKRLNFIL